MTLDTEPTVGEGVDGTTPPPEGDHSPTEEAVGRQCEKVVRGERCTNRLPADAKPNRKYCEAHLAQGSGTRKRTRLNPDGSEAAPASVTNNIRVTVPKVAKDKNMEAVAEGAMAMLQLLPLTLAMTGDEVCPPAIEAALPAIANQLALLSKYHKGLAAFFTPGETTGELVAWLGLAAAVSPVIITVLVHHHMVSEKMADRLAAVTHLAAESGGGGEPTD